MYHAAKKDARANLYNNEYNSTKVSNQLGGTMTTYIATSQPEQEVKQIIYPDNL